jgi:hypothetical protein
MKIAILKLNHRFAQFVEDLVSLDMILKNSKKLMKFFLHCQKTAFSKISHQAIRCVGVPTLAHF